MKKLTNKRNIPINRITEAYTIGVKAKTDTSQHSYFKALYENLDEAYDDFKEIHNEIIGLIETDDEFKAEEVVRKDTDSFYFKTKALFSEIFPEGGISQSSPGNSVSVLSNQPSKDVDLPPLSVPTFDGNPRKWPTFYDVYQSLVHQNSKYSDIQKFQYLISFLESEPANLLRSIPLMATNYKQAYELLIDRYQNKRLLATTYWNALTGASLLKSNGSKDLRLLLDCFSENIAALKNLNFPVDQWCFVLFNMLLQKLDNATRTSFEIKYSTTEMPTYEELYKFLQNHCKALESVQQMPSQPTSLGFYSEKNPKISFIKKNSYQHKGVNSSALLSNIPKQTRMDYSNSKQDRHNNAFIRKCDLCKNSPHPLYQCPSFIAKSPAERFAYVKQQNLCLNCFRDSHLLKDCPSTYNCRTCHYRHHTMIHLPQPSDVYRSHNNIDQVSNTNQNTKNSLIQLPASQNALLGQNAPGCSTSLVPLPSELSANLQSPTGLCASLSATATRQTTVLLSTTKLEILDARGNYQSIRAILDNGSQANFISQTCLNRLGLTRKSLNIPILGLNQSSSVTKGVTSCNIRPVGQINPILTFEAFVLPRICAEMPSMKIDYQNWHHIINLKLGDDQFDIPAPVDVLLGAEMCAHVFQPGSKLGDRGQPTAFQTIFGWVLLGKTELPIHSYFMSLDPSLDQTIRKFWELESIKPKVFLSPEDQKCEEIYQKTTKRDISGAFVVNLPFRHAEPDLGNTYNMAYRCFMSLESKLIKDPALYNLYADFMHEYIKNNHMSLISNDEPKPLLVNYLPHHCVVNLDKPTTKLRVVFNASAKGTKGLSLNQTLLTGPKLQTDISEILLKFRFYTVVFLADIKQMYLQILINPDHRNFQRLLWRFDPKLPLQEYRLNSVTFGVSSSPFLAIRTIRELATLEKEKYPEASQVLLNNIFMDDICVGSSTLEKAKALQQDLIALLKPAGFELRKWASNNLELLSNLNPSDCQIPVSFDAEESISIKVLGLQWNPSSDTLSYCCISSNKVCTKRNILSEIARIFDPLGFLAPVSFFAKNLMQRLWIDKVSWDESPSEKIVALWTQFKNELPILSKIAIPRHIFPNDIQRCQLFGFSDASEAGYASAVYLRIELPQDVFKSFLIMGKSKVAPLRTKSIPCLELLGAALLADLIKFVIESYSSLIIIDEMFAFSDSEVVLAWLASSPHRWKSFVANRVSHIQETIPSVPWYYIPSLENPADCASRGLTPENLVNHSLWFNGPPWLTLPRSQWNLKPFVNHVLDLPEMREDDKPSVLLQTVEETFFDRLLQTVSSLNKIIKILCHFIRFVSNFRSKGPRVVGAFSASERYNAMLVLVKRVQEESLTELIAKIKANALLPKPVRRLAPFLDAGGFVRVGGRLRHSELSFEAKHPLLLPQSHRLTDLIIEQIHRENLHPGLNTVQYLLRQKFWILSARRAIKRVLSRCIRCFRLKPKAYTPYMGDLPSFRISQLKCFSHVALDYAGPLKITMGKYRGAKVTKAYICLFVCCAVKAIHLELVSDLTTEAFIAALRRFVARRGTCVQIISDCGSNFVGAIRQLQELSRTASENLNIKWHLNSPSSPHLNGLAEAGVKSVKTQLFRVIGEQVLTYEELYTLLTQIEASLNSRPISEMSPDPNDLQPLTPGHFLTLEPLNSCPDPDLSTLKLNTLNRWQLIQRLHADFWKRWKSEYLNTLQQRNKWADPSTEVSLNALVIIKDETKSPLHWLLGRIIALHPGKDNHVRVVTVRTKDGILKRPIVKLCPLPTVPVPNH